MALIHQKRLVAVIFVVAGLGMAIGLILYALSNNINLFYTPTQLSEEKKLPHVIRIGGMVVKNSVHRKEDLSVDFLMTDFNKTIKVNYKGILPDLFKEGQGVVALGKLETSGSFEASQILAKHDEKYMPPEVKATLKVPNVNS